MVTGWAASASCRSPRRAACAPSPPMRWYWPPVRASDHDRRGWSPGDRPDGVYTTGQLQNLVHVHHAAVGDVP